MDDSDYVTTGARGFRRTMGNINSKRTSGPRGTQGGFTYLEVLIGAIILAFGLISMAAASISGRAAAEEAQEKECALQVARRIVQDISSPEREFTAILDSYTRGVLDSVTSLRTTPLPRTLSVHSVMTTTLLPDNATAKISFPMTGSNSDPVLREDVAGRDLNGDGTIDSDSHTNDYKLLPVKIRVEWTSPRGTRFVELQTILTSS